jgi:signal transduction histidine kinase
MSEAQLNPERHPSIDDLKSIPVFADLKPEQLEWLQAHFSHEEFHDSEVIQEAGTVADAMVAIFQGELQAVRQILGSEAVYQAPAGMLTGKLPFSRMKAFPSAVRAVGFLRVGRLHEQHFPEMLQVIPLLAERLVGLLSDRIRETAVMDQNREKLAALGKISAGLAHELNNPAAAASRASKNLRDAMKTLAAANRKMCTCPMSPEQRVQLAEFETNALEHIDATPALDTLAQSDKEQELTEWLEARGILEGWELGPVLVENGIELAHLETLLELTDERMVGTLVRHLTATLNVERLLREIDKSTDRISEMIRAVKEYSYMDQVSFQEIDLHRGIKNTLTTLNYFLKHGVNLSKEYDTTIPRIMANGSELNQVWTNLIQNAVQAMNGKGELRIRTLREPSMALVEIEDNGPGIAPEVQSRIFEPFFTTKPMGEGTGLGLDVVYRIIRRHHGVIKFTSKPGQTIFQVRLPFVQKVTTPEMQPDEAVHAH